jgi:hypothetical protein
MRQLVFDKGCNLLSLQEELLNQVKSIQPKEGLSQLTVTGNEEKTILYVPEDLSKKDKEIIKLIVENHQPPDPVEILKAEKLKELVVLKNAKLDSLLFLGDGRTMRSQGETLAWSAKVQQAKLFQQSGDLADCPLLVTETTAYLQDADVDPTTTEIDAGVRQLASRLISKEPILQEASAKIVGRAGRLEQIIRSFETVEELQQFDLAQGWD